MPRWGKIGKQKIVDEGPLAPDPTSAERPMTELAKTFLKAKYDMTTFDEVLVKRSNEFMEQGQDGRQAVLRLAQHARMHVWTFLSKKYQAMMNSKTNYGLEEAGMARWTTASAR